MSFSTIVIVIVSVIWVIALYHRYNPKIDIVVSKNRKVILLWYYKYYYDGDIRRTYIKLFEIK